MKAFFEGGFPHICGKKSLYDILKQTGFESSPTATSASISTSPTTTTTETIVGFGAGPDKAIVVDKPNKADKADNTIGVDRSTQLESVRKMYMTSRQLMGSQLQTRDYWKQVRPSHMTGSLTQQPPMNILKHLR
jgi:hypothetical protein